MSYTTVHIADPWGRGPDVLFDLETSTIYDHDSHALLHVAYVHERADNPGPSVTNAAEHIYAEVQRRYAEAKADHGHDDGLSCYVVEVYDDDSYDFAQGRYRASYALVVMDAGRASWRHLGSTRDEAMHALYALVAEQENHYHADQ